MAGPYPNDQGNPAGAIPVYVTSGGGSPLVVDASDAIAATTPTDWLPANPTRRYLFIQCQTSGVTLAFNPTGSPAGLDTLGSITLQPGQAYESGSVVFAGAISLYASGAANVTVLEG